MLCCAQFAFIVDDNFWKNIFHFLCFSLNKGFSHRFRTQHGQLFQSPNLENCLYFLGRSGICVKSTLTLFWTWSKNPPWSIFWKKTGPLRTDGSGRLVMLLRNSWENTWSPQDSICKNMIISGELVSSADLCYKQSFLPKSIVRFCFWTEFHGRDGIFAPIVNYRV